LAERYDTIVIGLGGMGSATAYHLARRRVRVLGLEQFDLLHEQGSSHGLTRIIRLAYHEHPDYVPLLRRAYELWHDLEQQVGERLLTYTGSLEGGAEDGALFRGALEAAQLHELPHEVLNGAELRRRFPAYRGFPDETRVVLQPSGGFLAAERCVLAHVQQARRHGAQLRFREPVTAWQATDSGGVEVETTRGRYEAERLVICAGAWASRLLPQLQGLAEPERQVLAWLEPSRPEVFTPERFPVFYVEVEEGPYYGFPEYEVPGFKFGRYHHRGQRVDADRVDRAIHPEDEVLLRSFAERYFPDGAGPAVMLKVCLFTNSPDEHFILDLHPRHPQVALAAGFSGHGFKFCSVVGEIMADLSQHGETGRQIGLFRLDRFS
jgi:sarcosine oxidase